MPIQRAKPKLTDLRGGTPLTSVSIGDLPAGSVLQVQHRNHNPLFSTSSTSFVDITNFSVTITPSSTSSKILLFTTGSVATLATGFAFKFTQDGSDVGVGDAPTSNTNRPRVSFKGMSSNGNRSAVFSGTTILSPSSTSSLTYELQFRIPSGGGTITTQTNGSRSAITLMEVAA